MQADFDLQALSDALDAQRFERGLTWSGVARQFGANRQGKTVVSTGTISGVWKRQACEGDGVLQMLLWLDRTPESFIPGFPDADAARYHLTKAEPGKLLRWDSMALYAAVDAQRQARGITWAVAAREMGGVTPGMLNQLSKGSRTSFPAVMRITRWLDQSAARFTRTVTRRAELEPRT